MDHHHSESGASAKQYEIGEMLLVIDFAFSYKYLQNLSHRFTIKISTKTRAMIYSDQMKFRLHFNQSAIVNW